MRPFLVLVLLLGLVAPAEAQDGSVRPPDIPPGEDVIRAVSEGERVPYRGMLLDTDTAIRWTMRLRWWQEEFQLVLRRHEAETQALTESHARELEAVSASYVREIEGLRGDLRAQAEATVRAGEREFYDTMGFGLVLGVVLAGAVVAFTAWALSSI